LPSPSPSARVPAISMLRSSCIRFTGKVEVGQV
jgi:hypothetical protein